jgi:DNA-binding MarR family transcriptional regulator
MRFADTLGLSYALKVVENEMRQRMDLILKPLGLTSAQYSALAALEAESGLTNADLARRCSVTPQTMIRLVQTLEAGGFLEKTPDAGHSLKINFHLTPKARDVLCDAHVQVNTMELGMVKGLPKAEVRKLLENIESCRAQLRKMRARED